MSKDYWILLILSAFLYALPFWDTTHCWWMVFLFPIPFFWAAVHSPMTFLQGYVWGISIFVLHLWSVLVAITKMADGPLYMRVLPSIFIVAYQSLFTGLFSG